MIISINDHQEPTLTGIRIRNINDAHIIFYAVAQGILKMIKRRLGVEERAEVRAGNIYIWEERSADEEAVGMGMERWTDGLQWGPSRTREEFLFYLQKPPDEDGNSKGRLRHGKRRRSQPVPQRVTLTSPTSTSTSASTGVVAGTTTANPTIAEDALASSSSSSNPNTNTNTNLIVSTTSASGGGGSVDSPTLTTGPPLPPALGPGSSFGPPTLNSTTTVGEHQLVKQTYSVYTKLPTDPETKPMRKWHLTAYYTTHAVHSGQLSDISNDPRLAHIPVPPENMFVAARSTTRPRGGGGGGAGASTSNSNSNSNPSSNVDSGSGLSLSFSLSRSGSSSNVGYGYPPGVAPPPGPHLPSASSFHPYHQGLESSSASSSGVSSPMGMAEGGSSLPMIRGGVGIGGYGVASGSGSGASSMGHRQGPPPPPLPMGPPQPQHGYRPPLPPSQHQHQHQHQPPPAPWMSSPAPSVHSHSALGPMNAGSTSLTSSPHYHHQLPPPPPPPSTYMQYSNTHPPFYPPPPPASHTRYPQSQLRTQTPDRDAVSSPHVRHLPAPVPAGSTPLPLPYSSYPPENPQAQYHQRRLDESGNRPRVTSLPIAPLHPREYYGEQQSEQVPVPVPESTSTPVVEAPVPASASHASGSRPRRMVPPIITKPVGRHWGSKSPEPALPSPSSSPDDDDIHTSMDVDDRPLTGTAAGSTSVSAGGLTTLADNRALPPLDFGSIRVPFPTRTAEDERALWMLNKSFNSVTKEW